MKKYFQFSILFVMFLCFLSDANAFVVDVKSRVEKAESKDSSKDFNANHFSKKESRKSKRLEKKLAKFQKKWERRAAKKALQKNKKRRRFFGGVSDDIRFKLGLILIVASLLVGILARVPLFGGLFGILAGIAGLVGLVLILLALLDYF